MTTKKHAAFRAAVAIAVVAQSGAAFATDTTIAAGQTETTTQALPGAGDSLTIDKSGAVSTSGANAVEMSAANQTVTNRGSIEADDASADGIQVDGDDAIITNYGTISVRGLAYGVHSTALNTQLVNYGGVFAYADCAYGVFAEGDYFSLTNHGEITLTASTKSYGVYVEHGDHATILNNGTISTTGTVSDAVTVWGRAASITNNGTIRTSGDDSIGVYTWYTTGVDSQTVITNTGTIHTSGTGGSQAVYLNDRGATLINSGTIIAEQDEAIYMGQADQTLTLLPGSRIEGDILFAQAASATINVERGLDTRLELTGIPGTINTNGQPYALVGNALVVLSEEAAVGSGAATSAMANSISGAISGHIGARRSGQHDTGSPALGYLPSTSTYDFPDFAPEDNFGLWASAFGSFSRQTKVGAGGRSREAGGLVGFDARLSEDALAGVYGGLGQGVVTSGSGTSIDTTSILGGSYASYNFGPAFVDVNASVGAMFGRSERKVANNKVTGGFETAKADFGGVFVSPAVTLGVDAQLGAARVTPSVALMYAGIFNNAYEETGSSTNLSFGSRLSHAVTARAQVELGTLDTGADGFSGSLKVGAEGTISNAGAVDAKLLGAALHVPNPTSRVARAFTGMDLGFTTGRYDLNASGEVGYDTEGVLSASLQGGFRARF
jgi:uncharacterized protein with beta-barrel porin domain